MPTVLIATSLSPFWQALAVILATYRELNVTRVEPERLLDALEHDGASWAAVAALEPAAPLAQLLPAIHSLAPRAACLVQVGPERDAGLLALRLGAYAYLTAEASPEEAALLIARAVVAAKSPGELAISRVAARRARNISTVRQVATVISAAGDLTQTLTAICEAAVGLFEVDHSGLVFFDDAFEEAQVVAEYPPLDAVGTRFALRGVAVEERLVAQGSPVVIDDVRAHSVTVLGPLALLWRKLRIASILIVPIVYGERVIGSFSLDVLDTPRPFSEEIVEMCEIFAAQAAMTLAQARQLEALRRTTLALTARLDEASLLKHIVREATELLRARSAGIYLIDQGRGGLRLVASHGYPSELVGKILPFGEGMAGRLLDSNEPYMIVEDYRNWPGRASIYSEECPFDAVIAVTLRSSEQVLGVLFVDDGPRRAFTPLDSHLLRIYADYAAIALLNSEKLRQLKELTRASGRIMGQLDGPSLQERLDLIARLATEILTAEASAVLLVARPEVLRLVAGHGPRTAGVELGHEFAIGDGPEVGLTGLIAFQRRPFRAHGAALQEHEARPSRRAGEVAPRCHSLLVLPLFSRRGAKRELVGLIRVENKKDRLGHSSPELGFSEEDQYLFQLFADAVAIAVENATQAARWQLLIDSSPNSLVMNDEAGRIVVFSRPAQELLGYSPDEVVGQHVSLLFAQPGDEREVGRRLYEGGGRLRDHETVLRSRDNEPIPIRLAAASLYDGQGLRAGAIGYFEDLRPAVRNEERLQRLLTVSAMVRRIGDYIQGAQQPERVLRILLNGVTANYGLRMNRAVLLLYEADQQCLVGAYAVGHREPLAARLDWADHPDDEADAFERFIAQLDTNSFRISPLETRVAELRLELKRPGMAPLSRPLLDGQWARVEEVELDLLPTELVACLRPGTWLMAVPLSAGGPIGLLLADNAITGDELSGEECDLLMAMAGSAALAVANIRLLEEARASNARLSYLFQASTKMISAEHPQQILAAITERIKVSVNALWVSLFLIDAGILRERISTRTEADFFPEKVLRKQGISMWVMEHKAPRFFEDTARYSGELNPLLYNEGVGAAACVPFVLRERSLGVVWIHYAEPRHFSDSERQALYLFVNQAAIAYENASRLRHLERMRAASDDLVRAQTWDEVQTQIARHARSVLGADAAIVWSFDRGSDAFVPERSTCDGITQELMQELRQLAPGREGASSRALKGQWIVVENVFDQRRADTINPRVRQLLERCDCASCQIVGLRMGEARMGVLYGLYHEPRSFSEGDREQSQEFADHAAQAMHKAEVYESTNNAHTAAQSVSQALVRSDDVRRNLVKVANHLRDVLDCDVVSLYLYDARRDWIDNHPVRVGMRVQRPMNRPITSSENPALRWALRASRAQFVSDISNVAELQGSRFAFAEGIRACAAAPLRVGDKLVGVLFVNYRSVHRFTRQEQLEIRSFANQAAIAINNYQLLWEHKQQSQALMALHKASYAITRYSSLEELYQTIVEQAVRLFHERASAQHDCFAHYGAVRGSKLEFAAAYPPAHLRGLQERIGTINLAADEGIGVTGAAVKSGKPINLANVATYPGHLPYLTSMKSELAVPVVIHGISVGVINLESPLYGAFTAYDEYAVEALAQFVAAAIEHDALNAERDRAAQERAELERRDAIWRGVHNQATDLGAYLRKVCASIEQGRPDYCATVRLYDPVQEVLFFDPSWSESYRATTEAAEQGEVRQRLGHGICGWVAQYRTSFRTGGVDRPGETARYAELAVRTVRIRSELCVPILYGDEPELMGVLDLQSTYADAFSQNDEEFLADLAMAIGTAIHAEWEQQRLRAAESVALTGVAGSLFWHNVVGDLHTLKQLLNRLSKSWELQPNRPSDEQETLATIHKLLDRNRQTPQVPPLDPRETDTVELEPLLSNLARQVNETGRYEALQCTLALGLDTAVRVRGNRSWLRHCLRLLIDNAAKATEQQPLRQIAIETRRFRRGSYVEIAIRDNGRGIAPELVNKLFIGPMESKDGLGIGTILAKRIAETYGGYIRVADPGPITTTITLAFPVAQRSADDGDAATDTG